MNIFAGLKVYAAKWAVASSRVFSSEELALISEAVVVPSQYGYSAQFTMKNSGITFIPMSSDSTLSSGEAIDLSKAKILTLHKDGEADIYRVSI